jgi:hypothetical protein
VSFHVGTIMWGLYFGVFHRDGRLFEIGNVFGHRTTHLEMGSRIVDRQPSNLNWTCVTFPTPGPDSLLSNVVTLLVSVPHRLAICIFEE